MKQSSIILLLTLIFGFMSCNEHSSSEIKVVSPEEMKSLIQMDDVQLVDVRTKEEYNTGFISNSQNIDITAPDFEDQISKLDKKKPVLVYCKAGTRSAKCAQKLKEAGFEKIYDLSGGITKWKYTGYQIQTKS